MGSRALAVFVVLLACACSPELDWRELKSPEGAFTALIPAKPHYEIRALASAPQVVMHLWSARAANSVFGVSYADYPAMESGVLDRTRDALVKNFAGRLLQDTPLAQAGLSGREFSAENERSLLRVRLLVSGERVYQLAVLCERGALSAADIDLFLSSFRPTARRS